jgi:hypothetical protein
MHKPRPKRTGSESASYTSTCKTLCAPACPSRATQGQNLALASQPPFSSSLHHGRDLCISHSGLHDDDDDDDDDDDCLSSNARGK